MDHQFAGIIEFITVVDQGSFTNAAEVLGLTGSAVGKSMNKLEKDSVFSFSPYYETSCINP